MDIKKHIIINLSEKDLKEIILEFVKKQGYETDIDNIKFDLGTVWKGYGLDEHKETVFKGCTIKCNQE